MRSYRRDGDQAFVGSKAVDLAFDVEQGIDPAERERTQAKVIRMQTNVVCAKQWVPIWLLTLLASLRDKAVDALNTIIAVAATLAGLVTSSLLHNSHAQISEEPQIVLASDFDGVRKTRSIEMASTVRVPPPLTRAGSPQR